MDTETGVTSRHVPVYYEALGGGHDHILRCDGCMRLVLFRDLVVSGGCPKCGNRRVTEVRTLSNWEWLRIRIGLLSFPYRKEFLVEFSRGR